MFNLGLALYNNDEQEEMLRQEQEEAKNRFLFSPLLCRSLLHYTYKRKRYSYTLTKGGGETNWLFFQILDFLASFCSL